MGVGADMLIVGVTCKNTQVQHHTKAHRSFCSATQMSVVICVKGSNMESKLRTLPHLFINLWVKKHHRCLLLRYLDFVEATSVNQAGANLIGNAIHEILLSMY